MITQRDYKVISFLEKFKIATTSTISELFYPSLRVAQKRLLQLYRYKEIKRDRDNFTQEYYYYINKPRQLKHSLLLTNLYGSLSKLNCKILKFEKEVIINNLRADGFVIFQHSNKTYLNFVEVQISNTPLDIDKYRTLLFSEKYKDYGLPIFPRLLAVTNKRTPKVKEFKIIKINENMDNVSDIL